MPTNPPWQNFQYALDRNSSMKRGRPKGRSSDNRSYGPLGDLIRTHRISKGLGLQDVAEACRCSVQFVSNIEHGRAPLPWQKVELLADALGVKVEEVRAANLAVRSDFVSFMSNSRGGGPTTKASSAMAKTLAQSMDRTLRDAQLRDIITRYQTAPLKARKKFVQAAKALLG
jgi:transcriptional regulator with XRE-family HTH domain